MEQTYTFNPDTGEYVPVQAAPVAVQSSDPNYWSGRNATILRKQWDYWQQQYKPLEEEYASLVLDPTKRAALRNESLGYVTQSADASHARGLTALANRDARLGVGLDSLEQASRERKMGASAAAVKAKGLTDMAGYLDDREQQMMSGGISYARTS